MVVDTHVAHELFHHLESTRIRPVHDQLPPVVTFRLGPLWTTRTRARRCRELAAHAFAEELLGLPLLPNTVDYLILIAAGKWSEREMNQAIAKAQAELAVGEGSPAGAHSC